MFNCSKGFPFRLFGLEVQIYLCNTCLRGNSKALDIWNTRVRGIATKREIEEKGLIRLLLVYSQSNSSFWPLI